MLGDALKCVVLGGDVGAASAFKLAFAGFNKGLVALFLEVMAAADRLGQRDELLECLRAFYPGTVETVERLLPSYPRHAARRAEEMDELAERSGRAGIGGGRWRRAPGWCSRVSPPLISTPTTPGIWT